VSEYSSESAFSNQELEGHIDKARRIVVAMNVLRLPVRSTFVADDLRADIRDSHQDYGRFRFWGSIEKKFPYLGLQNNTAIIKDIKLPEELRERGLGKKLVSKWEEAALNQGIHNFVITNPRAESVGFWEKMGYAIPNEQRQRAVPYCMFKRK